MYGAQLIEALRSQAGGGGTEPALSQPPEGVTRKGVLARPNEAIEFFGVGGEKMRAAGCDTVVDASDLAVVGITEILSHLPKIWRLFRHLIDEADRRKPDLAIVIDSPAFNWRVARQMKKRGVPVVYYVCPQFWAWRQGRVKLLRKYVDKALVIFPFEEDFYRKRGVDAEFVGHPLAELARPVVTREEYAKRFELDPAKQWITLMPGSRRKEVRMNLPGILQTARMLGDEYEFLIPVAPTIEPSFLKKLMEQEHSGKRATSDRVRSNSTAESGSFQLATESTLHFVPEALPALSHSRAGIIASGTATVEAALMELPFVMVYRVTATTYLLGRSTVKVPYFAMVNLIAGQKVVPELVQHDFTPEAVLAEIRKIIPEGPARSAMLDGLRMVKAKLRVSSEGVRAPQRAAEAIRGLLRTR